MKRINKKKAKARGRKEKAWGAFKSANTTAHRTVSRTFIKDKDTNRHVWRSCMSSLNPHWSISSSLTCYTHPHIHTTSHTTFSHHTPHVVRKPLRWGKRGGVCQWGCEVCNVTSWRDGGGCTVNLGEWRIVQWCCCQHVNGGGKWKWVFGSQLSDVRGQEKEATSVNGSSSDSTRIGQGYCQTRKGMSETVNSRETKGFWKWLCMKTTTGVV